MGGKLETVFALMIFGNSTSKIKTALVQAMHWSVTGRRDRSTELSPVSMHCQCTRLQ